MNGVDHKRLVQEYYSRRAHDYDRQKIRTWDSKQGFGDEIAEAMVHALQDCKGKPVLEVCVGTARTTLLLLAKVKPLLVGLDFSKEMLKIAKRKASSRGSKPNLVLGDAEHLPFAGKAFSAVVCTSSAHYFTDLRRNLAEFLRVLQDEGVFLYGDLTLHESDRRRFLDRLESTVSNAHGRYCMPSEVKDMLEDAGFAVSMQTVVPYRKSFKSLMEDKGRYFGVKPEALEKCVCSASEEERRLYAINDNELTLFYTVMKAVKKGGF
jgi:ubiquinone/menaquinone biosynthesis C-methylase UbiE